MRSACPEVSPKRQNEPRGPMINFPVMPNEDDVRLARNLAAKLAELEPVDFAYRWYLEPRLERVRLSEAERDIPLGDVLADCREFLRAARVSERHGIPFPCIYSPKLSAPVPLSIGMEDQAILNEAADSSGREGYVYARTFYENYLRQMGNRESVILVSPGEARGLFQQGLESFLTVRFGARQSKITGLPGFLFEVETDTRGLQVVYAGRHYLKAHPFEAPTSPVSKYIQPGGWIFGVASSGPVPVWDPRLLQYDVPYDTKAKLPM